MESDTFGHLRGSERAQEVVAVRGGELAAVATVVVGLEGLSNAVVGFEDGRELFAGCRVKKRVEFILLRHIRCAKSLDPYLNVEPTAMLFQ